MLRCKNVRESDSIFGVACNYAQDLLNIENQFNSKNVKHHKVMASLAINFKKCADVNTDEDNEEDVPKLGSSFSDVINKHQALLASLKKRIEA